MKSLSVYSYLDDGPPFSGGEKIQVVKMQDKIAGRENARHAISCPRRLIV